MRTRIVVVTSLVSGVGASTVALCLAQSAVDLGTESLLIDWVGNAGVSGLWGAAPGSTWLPSQMRIESGRPSLWTPSCGGIPLELLGSKPRAPLTVIDVRPNTEWFDVAMHLADAVVMVVGSNRIGDEPGGTSELVRAKLRPATTMTVVPVNQSRRRRELAAHASRIASALGCRISEALPYDRYIEQTYPLRTVPPRLRLPIADLLAASESEQLRAGQGAVASGGALG